MRSGIPEVHAVGKFEPIKVNHRCAAVMIFWFFEGGPDLVSRQENSHKSSKTNLLSLYLLLEQMELYHAIPETSCLNEYMRSWGHLNMHGSA